MTLKLWDLNKESSPVATYNVHEHLRARVCEVDLLPDLTESGGVNANANHHIPTPPAAPGGTDNDMEITDIVWH